MMHLMRCRNRVEMIFVSTAYLGNCHPKMMPRAMAMMIQWLSDMRRSAGMVEPD